jgi:N-acetyl-1-D-myo-inositol-2-amino-2-deoxy-alpha-D-glucopyranoside deacetylase
MHVHVPRPAPDEPTGARDRRRRTLVAVHAHPDDEAIPTGGILARYAAEGVRTVLITCTRGDVGEISDPALATPENLAEVRKAELAEAVRILGVARAVQLGYRDSGMAGTPDNDHPASFNRADLDEATARVVAVFREERPDVVVTYDENGGYGHPDHVRAHQVAVAAFHAAGDPRRFPEAGPPWAPKKLYFAVVPRSGMKAFAARLRAGGVELPWGDDDNLPFGVDDGRVTTVVDVARFVDTKREALLAHKTQLPKDGFFLRIPPELYRELFARETFQLVEGQPGGQPETDLFAGV